jgi:hypothetical protein
MMNPIPICLIPSCISIQATIVRITSIHVLDGTLLRGSTRIMKHIVYTHTTGKAFQATPARGVRNRQIGRKATEEEE